MMCGMKSDERIIVALDVDTAEEAFDIIVKFPTIACFKVGWQLFANEGLNIVQALSDMNIDVFLDLKIDDIPNTVEQAVKTLTQYERVKFFTFQGIELTMSALSRGCTNDYTNFLYVPMLSSQPTNELDFKIAMNRVSSGLMDGVIASGQRIKWAKERMRPPLIVVAPGIRQHRKREDHQVSCTAQEAFDLGADYIVVGREITKADDPEEALNTIL